MRRALFRLSSCFPADTVDVLPWLLPAGARRLLELIRVVGRTGLSGKRAETGRRTDLVEERAESGRWTDSVVEETGGSGPRKREVTESAGVFSIFKNEIVNQKGASQKRVSHTEIFFNIEIITDGINPRLPTRIHGWLIAPMA